MVNKSSTIWIKDLRNRIIMRIDMSSVMEKGSVLITISEPEQMSMLRPPYGVLILTRSISSITLHKPSSDIWIRGVNLFEEENSSFNVSKSKVKRSKTYGSPRINFRSSVRKKMSKGIHGFPLGENIHASHAASWHPRYSSQKLSKRKRFLGQEECKETERRRGHDWKNPR